MELEGMTNDTIAKPMHIPTDTIKSTAPHEIIALIGAPGSGKTTSCLSFPNRLWYDFEHKLPLNEVSIPLWDPTWVDKIARRTSPSWPPNRRDAFIKHFRENHTKFTEEQTVIIDNWTFMQNAFDQQTQLEEDQAEKPNPFSFWKRKVSYSTTVVEMLKACKCRIVVTFHETIERDSEGDATGKLRPVMDGSFKDQLLGHFTDVWRMLCNPYERDKNGRIIIKDGKKAIIPGWYWQIKGDDLVNTNTNPILGDIINKLNVSMVPASYIEIQKLYDASATKTNSH